MHAMVRGLVVAAAIAMTSVVVPATSAHAASCSGTECDGQWPDVAGCSGDAYTPSGMAVPIKHGTATTGWIELRYSPSCRTAWARVQSYYWGGVGEQAYIHRDHATQPAGYECNSHNYSSTLKAYSCYTQMVYDGGAVSHASGWAPNWYDGTDDYAVTGEF